MQAVASRECQCTMEGLAVLSSFSAAVFMGLIFS